MEKYLTVSEFTKDLKNVLEKSFHQVFLRGEISGLAKPSSGHYYLTLKDKNSQISAVIFRSNARKISFDLENGLEILVFGKITVYEPRGSYQIIVENVLPVGEGVLQLQFEKLKRDLLNEGLFDQKNKQPIPNLAKKIGVITSPTGAAIQDFLKVLNSRYPFSEIIIYPSLVQGLTAHKELIAGIDFFEKSDVELIVLTRGGGSLEDLWPFNEEELARKIFSCKKPVLSAVGHEIDITISDLVADQRAATPSQAAELLLPTTNSIQEELVRLTNSLEYFVSKNISERKLIVTNFQHRIRSPKSVIQTYIRRTDDTSIRLKEALYKNINKGRSKFERLREMLNLVSPKNEIKLSRRRILDLKIQLIKELKNSLKIHKKSIDEKMNLLESVSPLSTMRRGYSFTETSDGNTLNQVSQVEKGDKIQVTLVDGKIRALVSEKTRIQTKL